MATRKPKGHITFGLTGGAEGEEAQFLGLAKSQVEARIGKAPEAPNLVKSILNVLNGPGQTIERLAFEQDPSQNNNYAGVYKRKLRSIPDEVLARIARQDSLVSNIVRARQNHLAPFGRPRPDRFSNGFIIEPNTGYVDSLNDEQKDKFNKQVERAVKLLANCGYTDGIPEEHRSTFSEFLSLAARNAVVVGRIAAEVIYVDDGGGSKKFHHFVAADAGTIYKATTDTDSQQGIRDDAYHLLCTLTGKSLDREKYKNEEYCWIQAIDGIPRQAFTSDEMKCYNFYPVPDVDLAGYPLTPIDTVISAVTTHLNIVTHNRLYFQSGRAARGMLVIQSEDVNPTVVHGIKQQFNASINNVNNSWRMPVFGCGMDESITWQPIDSGGGKDMEFQYLTDLNAREIMTAFMMSPDELPGWSYLSRGTNNQALSEGNNEYKLQAARDVGIRPLLHGFEDFINSRILPLIDADLATHARVQLRGLESDNAEKESVRIQQDMAIWETYDGVLNRVEKDPIGKEWGGDLPLNPTIKEYWDQYFTVGEILAKHCNRPEAAKDPALAYRRDPFFFQWAQLMQAQQQQEAAAQAQQQQAGGQPPPGGGGAPPQGGGGQPPQEGEAVQTENQKTDGAQEASASPGDANDLARSIDMAFAAMSKSEAQLPPEKRRILGQQKATVDHFMRGWLEDMNETVSKIKEVTAHHKPRKQ